MSVVSVLTKVKKQKQERVLFICSRSQFPMTKGAGERVLVCGLVFNSYVYFYFSHGIGLSKESR